MTATFTSGLLAATVTSSLLTYAPITGSAQFRYDTFLVPQAQPIIRQVTPTIYPLRETATGAMVFTDVPVKRFTEPVSVPSSFVAPDESDADMRPAHARAIDRIQDVAGLSNARVAELLDVSPVTINNWKNQSGIRDENLARIMNAADVLRRAAEIYDTPIDLRAWLFAPVTGTIDGTTPYELLCTRDYGQVRRLLLLSPSNVQPLPAWAEAAEASPWNRSESDLDLQDDVWEG